jgi:RNA-directed DNA polymerase
MTERTLPIPTAAVEVNGPEDGLDWDAIDWRAQEDHVRRLRQRIGPATVA